MSKLKLAVAVLDIGTTGIRMLVGRMMENGTSKIIAKAEATVPGGIDLNDSDAKSKLNKYISEIIDKILDKTGIEVKSCYVSISNASVRMIGGSGEVSIIPRANATCLNVGELLNEASVVSYNDDETLIDIVPVAFYADGKYIGGKPEGVLCSTLSIDANAVVAKSSLTDKISDVLSDLNIKVDGFVPTVFSNQKVFDASSFTNLSRACITAIVDVGGEKTEISIFYNNIPFAFDTMNMGGNDITRDIAYVLGVSENTALRLKLDYPFAGSENVPTDSDVEIETEAGAKDVVKVSYIADIMNARIAEIASKASKRIATLLTEAGCNLKIAPKLYFIGDGIVHFKGATQVLSDVLETGDVEIVDKGKDLGIKNSFINSLGMILYISSKIKYGRRSSLVVNRNEEILKPEDEPTTADGVIGILRNAKDKIVEFFKKIWNKVKNWR